MRRDMELFRKLALEIESSDSPIDSDSLVIEGFTTKQIGYHCKLMKDEELIDGEESVSLDGGYCFFIYRLTNKGHDFVDAARNDTIWTKTMEKVGGMVGGVALSVLVEYLKSVCRDKLGLPST